MDAEQFFATEWRELVPSLRTMLARAGAPAADRDDLVQETATRLLATWDSLDWNCGATAIAHRIALNAWRDQWRRRGRREVLGEVPERAEPADTERVAMGRLRVTEVAAALATLPAATATVIRVAAGEAEGAGRRAPLPPAIRMARTRARRALAASAKVACCIGSAFAMSMRSAGRPVRAGVAMTALAGVAFVAAVETSPGAGAPPVSPSPSVPVSAGVTASAGIALPATRRPDGRSDVHQPSRPGQQRRSRRPATRIPYYWVGGGPAAAGVFLDVKVSGVGVQVRNPNPGESEPVCTYGSAPSIPIASQCH